MNRTQLYESEFKIWHYWLYICIGYYSLCNSRQVVKMMVVVVLTFALCWLPYHIYFILGSFNRDIYKQHYIQQVSSCLSACLEMYQPLLCSQDRKVSLVSTH